MPLVIDLTYYVDANLDRARTIIRVEDTPETPVCLRHLPSKLQDHQDNRNLWQKGTALAQALSKP